MVFATALVLVLVLTTDQTSFNQQTKTELILAFGFIY